MNRLAGKVALITGAGRGIGRACADLFAEEGATIIAADVEHPSELFELPSIQFCALDVSKEAHWRETVKATISEYGRIDVLVNNAGIGAPQQLHLESAEHWNNVIAVNQTGVFLGMREVLPFMQTQRAGAIINIASIWALVSVPRSAVYHATKGAIRALSRNAAVTYASDGIRVNSVFPGIVGTAPVLAKPEENRAATIAATPMRRMGTPREIAFGCLYLASDEASFVTGSELVIDGGYVAR